MQNDDVIVAAGSNIIIFFKAIFSVADDINVTKTPFKAIRLAEKKI